MWDWVLFFVTLVVVYQWLNSKPRDYPPGPPTVPILGSLPFINGKNFHFSLEKMREKFGPVIGMKFGPTFAIAVCGAKEVLEVLKSEDFASRPPNIVAVRAGEGVMFANGDGWKTQRRFTLRHLRDFGFGKTSVAEMALQEFEDFRKYKLDNKKEIEVSGLFNTSAINLLWAMIAGIRFSYAEEDFKDLADTLTLLFRSNTPTGDIFTSAPKLKNFVARFYELKNDRIDRILFSYFKRTIEDHEKTITDTPRDLIDVYITELRNPAKDKSFTKTNFLEVCRDLFAAGTESSSNSLSFCLLYLVLYPEWQEKLLKEIEQVLGDRPPVAEDRNKLPLVEAFITETMRSNPIAPMNIPRAAVKDTRLNDFHIPKDTFTLISLWSVLQDKAHWGDPERFRPERFITQDGKFVRDPYMLVFGGGSRVCLGESLARSFVFIFLVLIIQRFRIVLPEGSPKPSTYPVSGLTVAPQPFKANFVVR